MAPALGLNDFEKEMYRQTYKYKSKTTKSVRNFFCHFSTIYWLNPDKPVVVMEVIYGMPFAYLFKMCDPTRIEGLPR